MGHLIDFCDASAKNGGREIDKEKGRDKGVVMGERVELVPGAWGWGVVGELEERLGKVLGDVERVGRQLGGGGGGGGDGDGNGNGNRNRSEEKKEENGNSNNKNNKEGVSDVVRNQHAAFMRVASKVATTHDNVNRERSLFLKRGGGVRGRIQIG